MPHQWSNLKGLTLITWDISLYHGDLSTLSRIIVGKYVDKIAILGCFHGSFRTQLAGLARQKLSSCSCSQSHEAGLNGGVCFFPAKIKTLQVSKSVFDFKCVFVVNLLTETWLKLEALTKNPSGKQTWQWKRERFSVIFLARNLHSVRRYSSRPCLMTPEGTHTLDFCLSALMNFVTSSLSHGTH